MSTHLHDLFDPADLRRAIDAGYVRMQTHPTLPYAIYNYSEKAAFERAWTPVTRQCRGLVVHQNTQEVLARPFKKIFNHDEPDAPTIGLDELVEVADKIDGSLGIGVPTPSGWEIATRGSFASDQANHATALWEDRYAHTTAPPSGVTPLWEIVYPSNRIVVDYAGLDDLVLLGGILIDTGHFISARRMAAAMHWSGPVADTFPYGSFGEMLESPPRPNREGFVVRSLTTGACVKCKYADYVELHKIVTGMNERVVWEHLGAGKPVDELVRPLPDEFHSWVYEVAERLFAEQEDIAIAAEMAHKRTVLSLPENHSRKDYALAVADHKLRPYLFHLLDGRDPRPAIWKTLRPSGAITMTALQDAA